MSTTRVKKRKRHVQTQVLPQLQIHSSYAPKHTVFGYLSHSSRLQLPLQLLNRNATTKVPQVSHARHLLLVRQRARRIADGHGTESIRPRIPHGRLDANVRRDARDDELIDAALAQDGVEPRTPERRVPRLGDDGLVRRRLEVVEDLRVPGAAHEAFEVADGGVVVDLDAGVRVVSVQGTRGVKDGDIVGVAEGPEAADGGDDVEQARGGHADLAECAVGVAEAVLHVDDEEGRVGSQSGHLAVGWVEWFGGKDFGCEHFWKLLAATRGHLIQVHASLHKPGFSRHQPD